MEVHLALGWLHLVQLRNHGPVVDLWPYHPCVHLRQSLTDNITRSKVLSGSIEWLSPRLTFSVLYHFALPASFLILLHLGLQLLILHLQLRILAMQLVNELLVVQVLKLDGMDDLVE